MNKSEILRGMLVEQGIKLDDEREKPSPVPNNAEAPEVDRDLVRSLLVRARAPQRDLEWLVASCPSIAAAALYRPPRDLLRRKSEVESEGPMV